MNGKATSKDLTIKVLVKKKRVIGEQTKVK